MPAAESVALPGLDGIVSASGSGSPFVPDGDSVWELGTNVNRREKAVDDFTKRTKAMSADERSKTTYVCVLSRRWGSGDSWVTDMKALGHGWKDIWILTADDLATWMESCPGVEAWFREHVGLGSLGDVAIGDWFARWAEQTDPAFPPGVLTAGRQSDVSRLLDQLFGTPTHIRVSAASVDEAVAFVGAALLVGLESAPVDAAADGAGADFDPFVQASTYDADSRESLRERTLVIEDVDGWRRWSVHPTPHVLIPVFRPETVQAALDAGHHVVLPERARAARQEGRLKPLNPHDAASVWAETGIDFYKANELGTAARRNLRSLRRRMSRFGTERPAWSESADATLLASVLLAGSWTDSALGDQQTLVALAGSESWRVLSKSLAPLATCEDAPLSVLGDRWDFVDVVDAWESLLPLLTGDDLRGFEAAAWDVLTEIDPDSGLSGDELMRRLLDPDRPQRAYSLALRGGIATSLAVLGAVVGDDHVAGDRSGQAIANGVVRKLLSEETPARWVALVDVLQQLAEAAPDAFLRAVEVSLRADRPAVMELFVEAPTAFGESSSSHSSLLWALETLAFAPSLVTRVAVVLARLAVLDPGGRLSNRPAASLVSVLNLLRPEGAVSSHNRLDVLDAVLSAVPEHATSLLAGLVEDRGGGIVASGPRYRDWEVARHRATATEWTEARSQLCSRLLAGASDALVEAARLIDQFPRADLARILACIADRWSELDESQQETLLRSVKYTLRSHRQHASAGWSMSVEDASLVEEFLHSRGVDLEAEKATLLFTWTARYDDAEVQGGGPASGEGVPAATNPKGKSFDERRREVALDVFERGWEAVIEFAEQIEVPADFGRVLAEATGQADELALDQLNDSAAPTSAAQCAAGYVAERVLDAAWLKMHLQARPTQASRLLLLAPVRAGILDLLETVAVDQRAEYWRQVSPYGGGPEVTERLCAGLLAADRPFSAMVAARVQSDSENACELIIRVLSAPISGTSENPAAANSLGWVVGGLLDKLEQAGTPDEIVAKFEFFYLPLLDHHRQARAAHRELARKPELFAEAVAHCYRPDTDLDGTQDGNGPAEKGSERWRFTDAYFRLLRSWVHPLPGSDGTDVPVAADVQAWVDGARAELASRDRTGVASMVIGTALAGTITDADGTWPCEAVRHLLEQENDDDLDRHLSIARFNQRGVTSRGILDGGDQERELAKTYSTWAERVRDRWPRAGALLEELATGYQNDAQVQDRQAEQDARGNR